MSEMAAACENFEDEMRLFIESRLNDVPLREVEAKGEKALAGAKRSKELEVRFKAETAAARKVTGLSKRGWWGSTRESRKAMARIFVLEMLEVLKRE